jgi:hypothetical protein
MCKAIYLPVDERHGKDKALVVNLNELSLQFAAAAATSYYCATSGLVRIPKTVRCTRDELWQLERRIFDGAVPPSKLVSLRGSRPEGTAQSARSRNVGAADEHDGIIQEVHRDDSVETDELTGSIDLNSPSFDNLSSIDVAVSSNTPVESTDALYHDMEVGSSSLMSLLETKNHTVESENDPEAQDSHRMTAPWQQELVSASEYLEQNSVTFPDSRWCIQTSDDLEDGGVEVQETASASIVEDAHIHA